ncbi:MAG: hypothetical protein V4508_08880 [Pseudomonadota bacterium]
MNPIKSAPTAFRFDPTVKQALAVIAQRERRSMANMLEWLIRKHCEAEKLGWPVDFKATGDVGSSRPDEANPTNTND